MKTQTRNAEPRGFALVVTLSMMILLTVIAVGLLSLSSVSLRTSGQASDMSVARANAKMALMLAIGEIQQTAGLDTRVTAKADLLDESNPPVLGVWESWKGDDHEKDGPYAGRPKAGSSMYANHKKGRFQRWLTSSQDFTVAGDMDQLPETQERTGKVTLLGENSVGKDDAAQRQIHLTPSFLTEQGASGRKTTGSYAWWVSGENQKARLPRPYVPATDNAPSWAVIAKSHTIPDGKPFGLDSVYNDPAYKNPSLISAASKAITMKQGDLLDSTNPATKPLSKEYYHDLSTNSVGLLTNTATGGWRKDLSLLADDMGLASPQGPASNLPLFRVQTDKDLMYTRASGSNALPSKSLLYPWSDYRRGSVTGNEAIYRFPPIGSWTNLARYASLYKNMNSAGATSSMSTPMQASSINGDVGSFIHSVRVLPVVARIQWLFYHLVTPGSGTSAGKYDVKLAVQPVFTLWNPYNVTITEMGNITFTLNGSLPPVINYTICGSAQPKYITLQEGWINEKTTLTGGTLATTKAAFPKATSYTIATTGSFGPGETRVFSPQTAGTTLKAGYFPFTGSALNGNVVTVATVPPPTGGNDKITTSMSFDTEYTDKSPGVGLYLDMTTSLGQVLAYRMLYDKKAAAAFYPNQPASNFPTVSLTQAAVPQPFLSVTFGARMASNTHLPSKGFLQSSPFVNYTAMGLKSLNEDTIQHQYPGTLNNVNSPFEFSFQGLTSGDKRFIPDTDIKNHGFIVTGFNLSTGLSRCVIGELPSRPLQSLAELQNWDARFENPIPPFSINLVGNSDANPMFPSNAVVNSEEVNKKKAENLQNDDSYCLNHMLFDDWFFSSIAPEPVNFGRPASSSSAKNVFKAALLDQTKKLGNRSYKLLAQDISRAAASEENANNIVNKYFGAGTVGTTYKTIASRLEVEGMFNVNSTSVKAWRALLGHARNQKVPYIGSNGGVSLSPESDYPFSRFSVAGDDESKKVGASGGTRGAEYTGYRVFDGDQLDFLAEKMVEQVRQRGPFLSLSEFVNRQLSDDKGLALAGAIQTALNQLRDSNKSPYGQLEINTSQPSGDGTVSSNYATDAPRGPDPGYKFKEAAFGYSLYGVPGWTRQADVLRPLAPILSARDDTFTIRAYGDARDASGSIIKARAICEATIRRTRDYVDSNDDTEKVDVSTNSGTVNAKLPANALFGRRFEMVSFRWLSSNEV